MELFKGINQFKLPLTQDGKESVNVYVIEGTSGNLMIDTGWDTPEAFNALASEMKNSGFAMKDITDIFITHLHPDHIGLAGKLAELTAARIYMGKIDNELVDSRYLHPDALLNEMKIFLKTNGVPDWEIKSLSEASSNIRNFISPIPSINILQPGDHISMEPYDFQAVLTPGHSSGHMCLYEANKQYLFSGDHILPETVPNISYHPFSGDNPIGDYVNSLNTLAQLEVRFVFPGHGSVFSGLAPKIDDILRIHRDRMTNLQRVMGVEMKSAYDIAKNMPMFINGDDTVYDKLDPIERRLAVLGILAHLQYLVSEKKGKKISEADKTVYFIGE
jgi:glyoxylase-like metal-dependent hydrolase (beta-lactamase superfamily II)